jgi:hypothetical protein
MSRVPSASPPLPETDNAFRTQSTSFAAALVAADLLSYLHAELNTTGVVFCFKDPHSEGDDLKRRFDAGMFPRVEPKVLFSARGFLMDEMARLQGRGRHERKS